MSGDLTGLCLYIAAISLEFMSVYSNIPTIIPICLDTIKKANRTMKVKRPLWEQRNMFCTRIMITCCMLLVPKEAYNSSGLLIILWSFVPIKTAEMEGWKAGWLDGCTDRLTDRAIPIALSAISSIIHTMITNLDCFIHMTFLMYKITQLSEHPFIVQSIHSILINSLVVK